MASRLCHTSQGGGLTLLLHINSSPSREVWGHPLMQLVIWSPQVYRSACKAAMTQVTYDKQAWQKAIIQAGAPWTFQALGRERARQQQEPEGLPFTVDLRGSGL